MDVSKMKLNDAYLSRFVSGEQLEAIRPEAEAALEKLKNGTGEGSDFIGWKDLPVSYDREEFARIKEAAERIRKNSEVLVVIGIGGSYLGARAAIEFVQGNMHNRLNKDAPEIYYCGNSISGSALFNNTLTATKPITATIAINTITANSSTIVNPFLFFKFAFIDYHLLYLYNNF